MLAFFLKILLCLLLAAAIGYVVAWLLRGLALGRLREQNYRLTSDLSARDNQVSAAQSQVQDLRAKQSLIERELADSEARTKELLNALSDEQQRTTKANEQLRLEQEQHRLALAAATQRGQDLEQASARLALSIGEKESEISRLGLQLTPLLALPAALSARDSDIQAAQSRHDEAIAARAQFERELTASRNALEALRRENEEQLGRRAQRIAELEGLVASDKARLADLEALTLRRAAEVQTLRSDLAGLAALPATLATRDAELKELQQKFSDTTQSLRNKDQELNTARTRIEAELNAARGRSDGDLSQLKSRLATLASETQSRESTLSTLRVELDAARKTLESRSALLRDSEAAQLNAANVLKAKDAELARMRAEISTLNILPGKLSSIQSELATGRQRISSLEVELAELHKARESTNQRPPRQFATAPGQIDDLKHIYGVGPALEKTLQSLGVYQFKQVALWNPDDVAFFDRQLHEFHGRIEREHWVRSAQEEHYKKYGEWLGDGPPTMTLPETNR
jgi:predicted flap endonuclease-1-like 5' DNA nuclease